MSSKHLIDPALLVGLERLPTFALTVETLAAINLQIGAMQPNVAPEDLKARVEERAIPSPDGHTVTVLVHTPRAPAATARPAVLHIHGGGYVMGSAKLMLANAQQIAVDADCVVVSVDYRLPPATPHPGPLEDCYTGLKWLFDNAASLGADRNRIAVAGESAGGGLAAALALLARDRAEIPLIHQHLIYPMIDDRTCIRETNPFSGEFVWTPDANRFGWAALLGCAPGSDGVSEYAAAARAKNLAGLPPAFIYVGALDLFAEEDIDYARHLMRAGVPTELHVFPGAFHGFEVAFEAPLTRRAMKLSMDALHRALHGPTI
jgi:acetyl esterase/lipase